MFQKTTVLHPSKMTTIIEHLKCPVCFEIPSESVFQCKYGHTFCKQCSVYLKTCPQCRIQLGHEKIRNRTLEQLLDVMDFNCPNKELGCVKVLKRDEITSHLKYCRYEPFYFCKLIGFQSCSYNCDTKERAQNLLSHLNEAHPEILSSSLEYLSASTFSMMYENFYTKIHSLEKGCFSIWTPHLVKLKNTKEIYADVEKQAAGDEEMVLLFLCQVSEATKNVAWVCLCLTDSFKRTGNKKSISTQPGILVEYRIKGNRFDNGDLLVPEMRWRAPILGFRDIEKDLENYALRIPLSVFSSFDFTSQKGNGLETNVRIIVNKAEVEGFHEESDGNDVEMLKKAAENRKVVHIKELTSFVSHSCHLPRSDMENEAVGVVYEDVFCNGCNNRPIVDIRYKCLQCIDYDLCKKCMEQRIHSHHVFARIHDLQQNSLFNLRQRVRILKGKSSYI